jgi:hypothetical protein
MLRLSELRDHVTSRTHALLDAPPPGDFETALREAVVCFVNYYGVSPTGGPQRVRLGVVQAMLTGRDRPFRGWPQARFVEWLPDDVSAVTRTRLWNGLCTSGGVLLQKNGAITTPWLEQVFEQWESERGERRRVMQDVVRKLRRYGVTAVTGSDGFSVLDVESMEALQSVLNRLD